ncbi:MAG: hypothetical protein ACJ78L_12175, partial [Chloroflexota bacterium]
MTEAEFDRVLAGWFRDGPDVLPGDLVGNALVEVATTRQDRTIRPRASRTLRSSRLTSALIAAGVVITLLVSLAAGIDLGLVGSSPTATTDPSSSPTSAPSGAARASTPITSNSDGFSLVLPGDWRWAAPRAPNSQRFEDRPADRSLTVSVGDSVIDGGTAAACAPAKSNMVECGDLTIGYSIPYLTARSYEALDASLRGFLDRCDGPCPITRSETRLGPDQAIRLEVTIDDRHLTYIAAMHGYRPVVLSWDEP